MDLFLDPDGDLPFARLEGAVAKKGSVFAGPQATKQAFRSSLASGKSILLSAHGEFTPAEPWSSRISFHDGPMALSELVGISGIDTSLIILSCCEAGLSQSSSSDEPFGFPAILQSVGVASLVAPAWRVDDLATCLFVTQLQQELSQGIAPAVALSAAAHWLRTVSAHQTIERLELLEASLGKEPIDRTTTQIRACVEEQKRWLSNKFAGPEMPFKAPLYWAGFQFFGVPSNIIREVKGEKK